MSYTPLRGTAMNVSAHLEQIRKAPSSKTLVINVAGLWQVAYGRSDSYESAVEEVLRFASQKFHRVVLASTTDVFPEHFLGRSACPRAGSSIKLQGAHRAVDRWEDGRGRGGGCGLARGVPTGPTPNLPRVSSGGFRP